MKKIAKLITVNDGKRKVVHNGDFLFVKNYLRTEKIISIFLSHGWTLKDIIQCVNPARQGEGEYTFYLGGWDLLFEKEVEDIEDNGDRLLEEAISEALLEEVKDEEKE